MVHSCTRTLQEGKNLTFFQFIEKKKGGESRGRTGPKLADEPQICVNFELEVEGNCKHIKQREGRSRGKRAIQGNALAQKAHRKSLSEEVNPEGSPSMATLQQLGVVDISLASQHSCNYLREQGQSQSQFR